MAAILRQAHVPSGREPLEYWGTKMMFDAHVFLSESHTQWAAVKSVSRLSDTITEPEHT